LQILGIILVGNVRKNVVANALLVFKPDLLTVKERPPLLLHMHSIVDFFQVHLL
jgi:hypothetical protein